MTTNLSMDCCEGRKGITAWRPCLPAMRPYGKHRAALGPHLLEASAPPCCRSSVVEHPLGKGEVVSSILTGSTRICPQNRPFDAVPDRSAVDHGAERCRNLHSFGHKFDS